MKTALYVIWFLIPAFFFLTALWSFLERLGGKEQKATGMDAFRQGIFVLGCVAMCVLIDRTVLEDLVATLAPDWLPLGFFEALLLPFILFVAAKVFGGSKEILITKAPKPSQVRRKR